MSDTEGTGPIDGVGRFLRLDPEKRRKMWRRARFAAFFLVVLLIILFIFGGEYGALSIFRYQRYEKTLSNRLEAERAKSDSLRQLLDNLKTDSEFIERTARERLRMIKNGETIYRFEEKKEPK